MISVNIIGKMINADGEKDQIKCKLVEIRRLWNCFDINMNRVISLINPEQLNKNQIERDNERYKMIEKLSIDLYIDYEYYREFTIKNKSQFENCAEELTNLGYELREGDEWVNVKRPNIDAIIDNIFMSQLCRSILRQLVRSHTNSVRSDEKWNKQTDIGSKNETVTNVESTSDLFEQSKCVNCGIRTPENQLMCDSCVNLSNEKKTLIKYKECISENNKELISNDWICQYAHCEETNKGVDVYCKACGIQKSSVSIIGVTIWRCKNGKFDQIRICTKCEAINEIGTYVGCGCVFAVDQSSEDIQLNIAEEKEWKCEKYKSMNPQNQSICENCIRLRNDNGVTIVLNTKCTICEKSTEIIGEGMCGECFSKLYSEWICSYTFCGEINIVKDKSCKLCGIERLDVLKINVPIWRCKNHIRDQIWICGKCNIINELGKVCSECGSKMDQSSETLTKQPGNIAGKIQQIKEKNQLIINKKDFWICENCGLVSDGVFLLCVCCKWKRPVTWSCSHCSSKNEILVEVCVVCGRQRNENLDKNHCEKCGLREEIMEGLCGKCVLVRDSAGMCSNRLCRFRNRAEDDYCRNCGLYRYGYTEHGAPIYQRVNNLFSLVWACECGGINEWEQLMCENIIQTTLVLGLRHSQKCNSSRQKYFKWCPLCIYKHDISNLICKNCKQIL